MTWVLYIKLKIKQVTIQKKNIKNPRNTFRPILFYTCKEMYAYNFQFIYPRCI